MFIKQERKMLQLKVQYTCASPIPKRPPLMLLTVYDSVLIGDKGDFAL